MPLTDLFRYALAAAFSAVLIWAAVSDIRTRKIPNASALAVLGLFVGWAIVNGFVGGWSSAISGLAAAVIALVVTFGLYYFKIIGAGDSKIFAAAALFMGLGFLPIFAVATGLAGGVLAVVSLAMQPRRVMAIITMRGKGGSNFSVPYGAAISVAGIAVVWGGVLGAIQPFTYGAPAPVTTREIRRELDRPPAPSPLRRPGSHE